MLCDNSDDIETIQVYAMVLPDHEMSVAFLLIIHFLIFIQLNLKKKMYFIFQQSSRSLQEFSFGPHEFGRLEGVKKKKSFC